MFLKIKKKLMVILINLDKMKLMLTWVGSFGKKPQVSFNLNVLYKSKKNIIKMNLKNIQILSKCKLKYTFKFL